VSAEDVELVLSLQLRSRELSPEADVRTLVNDDVASDRMRDALRDLFDPLVQCTMRLPGMAPVTYPNGLDGVRDAWMDWLKHWASYQTEVEDVIDSGGRVVVVKRARGRPRTDAAEKTFRRADVWTVVDHKVVHIDFNVPVREALEADPTT